jgi:hypothetical protein
MSTQEGLFLLIEQKPGAQASTERSLEPMHCGFGEGPPVVMVMAFPARHAHAADFSDSTVSFDQVGFVVKDRADPRWCYEPKSALACPSIAAAPVIGAVADDYPGRRDICGSQQGIERL